MATYGIEPMLMCVAASFILMIIGRIIMDASEIIGGIIGVLGMLMFFFSPVVFFACSSHVDSIPTADIRITSDEVYISTPDGTWTNGSDIRMYSADNISEFECGDIIAFRNPDAVYQYIPAVVMQSNGDETVVTCDTTGTSTFTIPTDSIEYIYADYSDEEMAARILS